MKHQPIQPTAVSIRLPHRHSLFPKGWLRLSQRRCVSEKYDILLGRTKRDGAAKRVGCHSLFQALSLGLAAETWPMEDTTPQEGLCGCRGTIMVLWGPTEIGSWAGQYLEAMDNACLPSLCGHGISSVLSLCGRITV